MDLTPELSASNENLVSAATLFGESASRVVVSSRVGDEPRVLELAATRGVPARVIGRTGGTRLRVGVAGVVAIDCAVAEAEQIWSGALEMFFKRTAA